MSDIPSQAIIKAATKTTDVTDARGRVISVGNLNALEKLRMFEVIGAENSKNEAYLGYATLAFHVSAIDTVAISRPTGKRELEALIKLLDDDGINAVGECLKERMDETSEEDAREQIKN